MGIERGERGESGRRERQKRSKEKSFFCARGRFNPTIIAFLNA